MTLQQKQTIQQTWAVVSTIDDSVVGNLFYNRLFQIAPELRPLFRSPVPEQSKKLMMMLHYLIRTLEKPEELSANLAALAQRHVKYNVQAAHYNIVGSALLWTLEQGLGALWTDTAQEAWIALYTQVSNIMITAASVSKAAA